MITSNNNFSLSSALLAYSDSLRAKAAAAAGKTSDTDAKDKATGGTPAGSDKATTGMDKATSGNDKATSSSVKTGSTDTTTTGTTATIGTFKATVARQTLDKTQQDLAKAIREAVTKAGGSLKGEVAFSLDSSSGLKITGSAEDKAVIAAALKADKSSPSLASRLASLTKNAVTLESNNRSNTAISQAARHAKTPAAVMSLYNTLMAQQGTSSTTAVFTLSGKTSSLAYKGVVDTSA